MLAVVAKKMGPTFPKAGGLPATALGELMAGRTMPSSGVVCDACCLLKFIHSWDVRYTAGTAEALRTA